MPRIDPTYHGVLLRNVAIATAIVTAVCIVTIDEPLARWLATRDTWQTMWNRGIAWLEYPLGIEPWKWTGVCVLGVGSLASLLVPRMRSHAPAWLLVTLTHLLARNITGWLKWGTGRLRPSEWLKRGGDVWFRDGGYSFPSGHVVLFASILIPLAVVYPRTRPLLAIIAFVIVARVVVNAHFVSDALGGLALVAAITWLLGRALPSHLRPASRP
jgi:membrane-associated phospholipid phosphatase